MGFFGRGRERELAGLRVALEQAETRLRIVQESLDQTKGISHGYRAELQVALDRINELDPPPPTTIDLARGVVDAYLTTAAPTKNDEERANFAYNVLLSDNNAYAAAPGAFYASTPRH